MRAVAMTGFDTAPTLADLEVPEPAEGEVRVRVWAASVNGFDLAVAAGYTKDFMEHRFPLVLGKDFAGQVDAIGSGVTGYAVGDRVFGTRTKPYLGDGSFAEYVTVPTAVGLAPLPKGVSFTDAAALGLAGAAAHGVIEGAALEPGNTIVVIGATGGVGNQVVQLAAAAGARVIATAHADAERERVTGSAPTRRSTTPVTSPRGCTTSHRTEATWSLTGRGPKTRWSWSVTAADSSPPWCNPQTRCPPRPPAWSRSTPTPPARSSTNSPKRSTPARSP